MMWIEILSRHRDVVSRTRIDGDAATIGRDYSNDVVVDDPYVAARHVRLARDDAGQVVVEDLGSRNGVRDDATGARVASGAVASGRVLRIGETRFAVRDADAPVPAEKALPAAAASSRTLAALAVVALAMQVLDGWMATTGEFRWTGFLLPQIVTPLVVLAWAGIWALLGRLLSGSARFGTHLAVTLVAIIAFDVIATAGSYVGYAFAWQWPSDYAYVATTLGLGVLCYAHLRVIGDRHRRLKAVVVGALGLVAIGTQALTQADTRGYGTPSTGMGRLKPPLFRMRPAQDADAFFGRAAELQPGLDRARTDEPVTAGRYTYDDDD
ncbi:MAG: FHA domain-containing protein [Proteobacteria bacterium]|nr:FHA domain-containing protein [Pseudomonadota bacterium]